jgi:type I restriction enzyme S subunit
MNNDWFFEKFALIADAPGAVDRMRELVLQLAVQGKLVPQDPCDEPAGKLFELDDELSSASLSELPLGWIWARLEQLAEINGGFAFKSTDYTEEGARVVRISDFDEFGFKDHKVVRHSFSAEFHKFTLEEQNILMAMTGGTVGKSYFVRFMPEVMVVNQRVATIKVLDSAMPRYIDIVIRSEMTQEVIRRAKNSTNDNISMGDIKGFKIPLPPLAEQKRIVAKVDELMGLCDELEAQHQERELRKSVLVRSSLSRFSESPTRENLGYLFHNSYDIPPSELRKSILTLAVQGKLVPQDPEDEPAENIVRRSETERHGSAAEGDGMQLEGKEFPWKLPLSWKWVRLAVLANIKHGYAFSSESFTLEPTQYVLTTPGNFYESGGFRDRAENTKYFKGQVPPAFIFNAGELIIPMTEQAAGLLGSPAFIPDDGKTYLHNQRIGKLEFYSDEVAPEYVFCFFNHEFFRDELARTCTGMKVRHTSPKRILKVPFALPPLLEQRRIVAKVDQLMALVDELERQQAASREKASNLLDAMVHEMTSGG